ncbi:coiled-coil domain-containing protein 43 isoform X1 [Microplitis demolitor]|uniref:coiled-coil domain-containing protein 43 isoform X1 n=1 Tax=Microplitis demolitor TaxID=69319 RepID=UPI0004CD772D|nr:coiled-coil domain-containing protein 43 isoform X1 [Microplitis demolitor]XP_008545363.1 coiled-coil domain-containing protein 43 isoform X1 [Microplitis demolitor]XP_014296055.1 coiled-coil domain-containing protein 43 isoform X1 [Microplitis demolitor]XP_014296056.1 coiled-coil domain-containing protein 43 isoform X1 [Microplitis demolitor]XP_014296057.1 coiled-coil domain-containing protein 43 isoform X1 [Microplitis demolitor]XP_053593492.1 coiled-coil domain-containing protein 43 isof
MDVAINTFDSWLSKKLQALNTDEGVFGAYIKGILEGDETEDEKTEALQSILSGITQENIDTHVAEIFAAWIKWLPTQDMVKTVTPIEDVDVRLARMLESQSIATTTQRIYTDEERRIREAVLAQYSQMSVDEKSDDEDQETVVISDDGLEKNMNAANIAQQERDKREKAKLDSQKKKDKDKEDREKQKQLKDEKKEKRKTQKGERRR